MSKFKFRWPFSASQSSTRASNGGIAVGRGAVAIGPGSVAVSGDVQGSIHTSTSFGSGAVASGGPHSSNETQQEVPVQGTFSSLMVCASVDVEWTQAAETRVIIHAEEHVLPLLDVAVRDRTLWVGVKPNTSFRTSKPLRVLASSPDVGSVSLMGSGDVTLSGVESTGLVLQMTGSGDVQASGKTGHLEVFIMGSGDFDGSVLAAQNATLRVQGSGDIQVTVANDVRATIMGSGDIRVRGAAAGRRETQVMGTGEIKFR
jgi:hypothetical protein